MFSHIRENSADLLAEERVHAPSCTGMHENTHIHTRSQVKRLLEKWTRSGEWNNGSKGVPHNTSSAPLPKPIWRLGLICIQISSGCITSGVNYGVQMGRYVKAQQGDWMDNFNLAKNGNPIQWGKRKTNYPQLLQFLVKSGGFQTFPFYFMLPCFWRWCVLWWDHFLGACNAWIFLNTHLSQSREKCIETSCHL